MVSTTRRAARPHLVSLLVVAAALSTLGSSNASAEAPERYPYDPVCPWGRIADGHGMMVRCLSQVEASALVAGSVEAQPGDKSESGKSVGDEAKPAEPEPAVVRDVVVTDMGPPAVDTGDLPLAVQKLGAAKARFTECVQKNGGLSAETGRVDVRFLVRERGRAEGVTVAKFEGLSKKAAKCVADVVDRRYVGYPAAPVVGATLPIRFGYR
jgi:hypothetical protein